MNNIKRMVWKVNKFYAFRLCLTLGLVFTIVIVAMRPAHVFKTPVTERQTRIHEEKVSATQHDRATETLSEDAKGDHLNKFCKQFKLHKWVPEYYDNYRLNLNELFIQGINNINN